MKAVRRVKMIAPARGVNDMTVCGARTTVTFKGRGTQVDAQVGSIAQAGTFFSPTFELLKEVMNRRGS